MTPLVGNQSTGARFGSTIASVGDMNQDGYKGKFPLKWYSRMPHVHGMKAPDPFVYKTLHCWTNENIRLFVCRLCGRCTVRGRWWSHLFVFGWTSWCTLPPHQRLLAAHSSFRLSFCTWRIWHQRIFGWRRFKWVSRYLYSSRTSISYKVKHWSTADLVVGSYLSNQALVFRSKPIVSLKTEIRTSTEKIDPKISKLTQMEICSILESPTQQSDNICRPIE